MSVIIENEKDLEELMRTMDEIFSNNLRMKMCKKTNALVCGREKIEYTIGHLETKEEIN